MFSIFKRKQKYVNVFISIIFNTEDLILYYKDGTSTGKVRWPIHYERITKKLLIELANMRLAAASSKNFDKYN
jgi:hypothetical protein